MHEYRRTGFTDEPENKFTTAPASGPRPGSTVGGAAGRCGADSQTCWCATHRPVGLATRRPGWGCTETGRRLEPVPTSGSAVDLGMDRVRTGALTHRWRRRRWRSMLFNCRSMSAWFFCSWTRRWLVPGVRLKSQHTAGSESPIWQNRRNNSLRKIQKAWWSRADRHAGRTFQINLDRKLLLGQNVGRTGRGSGSGAGPTCGSADGSAPWSRAGRTSAGGKEGTSAALARCCGRRQICDVTLKGQDATTTEPGFLGRLTGRGSASR